MGQDVLEECFLKTSGINKPATQINNPEDLNPSESQISVELMIDPGSLTTTRVLLCYHQSLFKFLLTGFQKNAIIIQNNY
jgi:hypothetical protein